MRATFEEKSYENFFNCELDRRSRIFFPLGQVQEGNLGFDATSFSGNRSLWRRLGFPFWFFHPFSGVELRDIADEMEHFLGIEIDNVPAMKTNLIFQYKKPDFISVSTGKEWQHWLQPYYRYNIYREQQDLLMQIHINFGTRVLVIYGSPALHNVQELVQAHLNRQIIDRSNFRKASDLNTHHRNTYIQAGTHSICCSDPEQLENFDLISEIESIGSNNQKDENNRRFIIDFRKRLVSIVSEDGVIGKSFIQLNDTYREFEKFELLYSFIIMSNFRSLTGTQWLITY